MSGTEHPPSTTSPARPLRGRRAILTSILAVAATLGLLALNQGSGDDGTDRLALTGAGASDATTSSTLVDELQELFIAYADGDAVPFGASAAAQAEEAERRFAEAAEAAEAEEAERRFVEAAEAAEAARAEREFVAAAEAAEAAEAARAAEAERAAAAATTTTAPPPPPPPPAPEPAPASTGNGDPNNPATWDRLAGCEANGNWHINTGNGYYGGLQFSLSSWQAVGGSGYPHEHSRETQIEMGKRLLAAQGWSAWPSCSRKLGYR